MLKYPTDLRPKFFDVLRERPSRETITKDVLAGVVVGIVALPLAIAFGIASGVRPEQGLYTAIVAGFLIALLSGSRVQIGGPTGAFVVLVGSVVAEFGYEGLAVATLMAGVFLIAMGLARMGAVIRFVPYPVTIGFTTGIALLIGVGQFHDALGLAPSGGSAEFIPRILSVWRGLGATDPVTAGLCAGSVAVVTLWPRVSRRVPGPLVALVLGTVVVWVFKLDVATVGSRFGGVPTGLPRFTPPHIDLARVPDLVSPAVSIALLGGIESLLSAVVADGMTGRRHRANAELVAQGLANIATPFFGGIPATGAIARTATNVKNGGRTPISGMVHAVTLLAIVAFLGRLVGLVPMAALAGILLVVAYHMSEWRVFAGLLRGPRSDVLVLWTTFALTVLVDLAVAIQVGVVLAALLFMRRMAEVTQIRSLRDGGEGSERAGFDLEDPDVVLPPRAEVFEIAGSFFFGAAQRFSEALGEIQERPSVVILRMRDVFAIDATGLHALDEVHGRLKRQGIPLLLSGVRAQPLMALTTSGGLERLDESNVLGSFRDAVARAWLLTEGHAAPPPGGTAGTPDV